MLLSDVSYFVAIRKDRSPDASAGADADCGSALAGAGLLLAGRALRICYR